MKQEQSATYFAQAQTIFPGGVNSPVRAFQAVGGQPLFIERAQGPYLYDVDQRRYIDYVLSWGPMILGHASEPVLTAVEEALWQGTSYGAPSPRELRLGSLLKERLPYVEKLRLVNSGTEATMSAIRLARGVTKRAKVVKFIGCYHGHSDSFLVQAGSGVASLGMADSAGVLEQVAQETLALPFNDVEALRACFATHGSEIACVILELVAGNMGLVLAEPDFVETLVSLTQAHGALLIVDEVMTGFRAHYQGASQLYQVTPDLVCLGKVIGGGLPMAAFGGKAKYMDAIAPLGQVYQAGTLSGNPLAVTAGYATLEALTPEVFAEIAAKTTYFCQGLREVAAIHQVPLQVVSVGTMFGFFFSEKPVQNFQDAKAANHALFAKAHGLLLEEGIYLAPSQYESHFLSAAHSQADLDQTLQAFERVFAQLRREGHG